MNKAKIVVFLIIALIMTLVILTVYRYFFEFNNATVRGLINDEASKWAGFETAAAEVIHDGCMHILSSRSLTDQVRQIATSTGVPKEKALVDAAIAQAYAYKYFIAQ